jgi:hypothetical protein
MKKCKMCKEKMPREILVYYAEKTYGPICDECVKWLKVNAKEKGKYLQFIDTTWDWYKKLTIQPRTDSKGNKPQIRQGSNREYPE